VEMSDAINEIAAAMAKAQAKMTGARKDSENPFFKAKYADLASVREACLAAMNAEGLSVWQFPRRAVSADGQAVVEVETVVTHASGQFFRDTLAVPVAKADAQGIGSAISYARRYALAAIASVAPADDDGEAAIGRTAKPATRPVVGITEAQQKRFFAMATEAGWSKDDLKAWLKTTYGLEHTRDIPRERYDEVCAAVADTAAGRHEEPPC
jgi:ERF superfamily